MAATWMRQSLLRKRQEELEMMDDGMEKNGAKTVRVGIFTEGRQCNQRSVGASVTNMVNQA